MAKKKEEGEKKGDDEMMEEDRTQGLGAESDSHGFLEHEETMETVA